MTAQSASHAPQDPHASPLRVALDWCRGGAGVVIATVVRTWRSAPRPVGSQLIVSAAGQMQGSVSGGCVEGAIVCAAQEMLSEAAPKPRLMHFGVQDADAFAVGLACGGEITVLLEPVGPVFPLDMLAALVSAQDARLPVAYQVDLEALDAPRRLLRPTDAPDLFAGMVDASLEAQMFTARFLPPFRMAIIGAVHITQALLPMAQIAGFDTHVIDPRSAFADAARFPGVQVSDAWPDDALEDYGVDAQTAVVVLTHDAKLDDPALAAALSSPAFYIGALGSRKTHAKRARRLTGLGFSAADIARIDAPIGLNIGARTPAEIAVAILGRVIEKRRAL